MCYMEVQKCCLRDVFILSAPFLSIEDISKVVLLNKEVRAHFVSANFAIDLNADFFEHEFDELKSAEGDLHFLLTNLRSIKYDRWKKLREPCLSLIDLKWLFLVNRRSLRSVSVQGHVLRHSKLAKHLVTDPISLKSTRMATDFSAMDCPEERSVCFPLLTHLYWTVFASTMSSPYEFDKTPLLPVLESMTLRAEDWHVLDSNKQQLLDSLVSSTQTHFSSAYWDVYRFRTPVLTSCVDFQYMHIIRADGWTELAVLLCRAWISQKFNLHQPTFVVHHLLLPRPATPQQQCLESLLHSPILQKYKVVIMQVLYKEFSGPRDVCIKEHLFQRHLVLYICPDLAAAHGLPTLLNLCREFIRVIFDVDPYDFILPHGATTVFVPPNPYVCANCLESIEFCRWQSEWSTASLGTPSDEASIGVS